MSRGTPPPTKRRGVVPPPPCCCAYDETVSSDDELPDPVNTPVPANDVSERSQLGGAFDVASYDAGNGAYGFTQWVTPRWQDDRAQSNRGCFGFTP